MPEVASKTCGPVKSDRGFISNDGPRASKGMLASFDGRLDHPLRREFEPCL